MTMSSKDKSNFLPESDPTMIDDKEKKICQSETCNHKIPQIEDFVFIKPISRGAFGKVFLGHKKGYPDKIYALKVMKKDYMVNKNLVRQVITERNALAVSRSPFIVQLYYSLQTQKNIYLVMEYMIGGDMKNLLAVCGYFDEPMALTYIAEVILALKFLHSLGIIHRDLKPDNMLISQTGHIKLTDLGLCEITINTNQMYKEMFDASNSQEWFKKCHLTPGQILSLTSSLGFSAQKSKMKASNSEQNENSASFSKLNTSNNSNSTHRHLSSATRNFHEIPPVCRLKDVLNPHETLEKSFCHLLDHVIEPPLSDSKQDLVDDVFNSPKISFNQSLPFEMKSVNQSLNSKEHNISIANQQKTVSVSGKSQLHTESDDSVFFSPQSECSLQPSSLQNQSISLTCSDFSPNLGFVHRLSESRKRKMGCNESAYDVENDKMTNTALQVPLKNKVHFHNLSSTPLSARSTDQCSSSIGIKKKISRKRQKMRRQKFQNRLKHAFKSSPKLSELPGKTNLTQELQSLDLLNGLSTKKARLCKTPNWQKELTADTSDASNYFSTEENMENSHLDSNISSWRYPAKKSIQFSKTLLRHEYKSLASLESDSKTVVSPSSYSTHSLQLNIPSSILKSCDHFNRCTHSHVPRHARDKKTEFMTPDSTKGEFIKSPFHTPALNGWCQQTPLRTPKSVRRCPTSATGGRVLGTPDYLAPEILLQQPHNEAVDWWALGVCMFEFLTGVPPFNDSTPEKVFQNILNRDIPWPEGEESLSENSCSAIEALLTMDPLKRPKAEDMMKMKVFENIHWDQLLNEPAPFQPQPTDGTDTSYFDVRNNLQCLVVSSVDL